MLDGKFIRENTELVKQALKNRGYDFDLDAFLQLDEKRRDLIKKIENIRFQKNKINEEIKVLLKEEKDVFVKPATITRLKPGMKIIFYASREDQGFYGEGEIESIEFFEDPMKILEKYGDRVFLTEKEFKEYIKTSERWRTRGRRPRP